MIWIQVARASSSGRCGATCRTRAGATATVRWTSTIATSVSIAGWRSASRWAWEEKVGHSLPTTLLKGPQLSGTLLGTLGSTVGLSYALPTPLPSPPLPLLWPPPSWLCELIYHSFFNLIIGYSYLRQLWVSLGQAQCQLITWLFQSVDGNNVMSGHSWAWNQS